MSERTASSKSADAYRTISEVADDLGLPQHVLRFWETRFPQVKPLKRAGGRRFYRPDDVELLRAVKALLYDDGYTIKGVQRMLRDQGPKAFKALTVTPSSAAPVGAYSATDLGEAPGETSADGSVDTSMIDEQAYSHPLLQPEVGGSSDCVAPANDSAFRHPKDLSSDVVERLQAVLYDLAACEQLIRKARNLSPNP